MGEAVVEYDYVAQEPDELTIRKGDVIREIVKKPGGWWEGTLRDKRGMFPDNFITLIQKEKVPLRHKPSRVRQCRAIFSYQPIHDDELCLSVGDTIEILSEVEEGWWKGKLGNKEGVFPSNFVEEIKSHSKNNSKEDLTSLPNEVELSTPSLPPKPTKIICQVKYPYEACNDDELTLREGDLITLISKDGQDKGWWRGELRGRVGVFPDNFVIVLPTVCELNGSQAALRSKQKTVDESKPVNVASQRKSLELKTDAPPLLGKKPNVPKKSSSSVNSTSLANLKQKIIDKVDGAVSSRSAVKDDDDSNEFDQIERTAMLPDMRANRVKAPGRRPPSVVYREVDVNLVNGNTEYHQQTSLSETSNDEEEERKPKVREWEKHRAPWVEELKLNQAKRTNNTSPGPTNADSKMKLTPTPTNDTKCDETQLTESKLKTEPSSPPVDMTKSLSSLGSKLKTPTNTNDFLSSSSSSTAAAAAAATNSIDKSPPANVQLRMKPQPMTSTSPSAATASVPTGTTTITTPVRPQSIHGVAVTNLSTSPSSGQQSIAPIPAAKPPVADKVNVESKLIIASSRSSLERKVETVSLKQYLELQDRLINFEQKMQQQMHEMQTTIDELRLKLQVEIDLRRLLQVELEKVAQCVTQV